MCLSLSLSHSGFSVSPPPPFSAIPVSLSPSLPPPPPFILFSFLSIPTPHFFLSSSPCSLSLSLCLYMSVCLSLFHSPASTPPPPPTLACHSCDFYALMNFASIEGSGKIPIVHNYTDMTIYACVLSGIVRGDLRVKISLIVFLLSFVWPVDSPTIALCFSFVSLSSGCSCALLACIGAWLCVTFDSVCFLSVLPLCVFPVSFASVCVSCQFCLCVCFLSVLSLCVFPVVAMLVCLLPISSGVFSFLCVSPILWPTLSLSHIHTHPPHPHPSLTQRSTLSISHTICIHPISDMYTSYVCVSLHIDIDR